MWVFWRIDKQGKINMTAHLVISSLVGFVYGTLVGLFKCLILWGKMLHPAEDQDINQNMLFSRMGIGYVINIGSLLLVFFLRHQMPFDFAPTLIAAAISLSLVGIIYPVKKIYKQVEKGNMESEGDKND